MKLRNRFVLLDIFLAILSVLGSFALHANGGVDSGMKQVAESMRTQMMFAIRENK